jgi:MoaA/NifB/PqqE/SkfB family radical SAM enzyme
MTLREALRLALQGGPGVCQVAVTNACNARCRFCSFPQVPPDRHLMADPARLSRGLAAMHRAGIRYVIFTGGEPLLYPHLLPILARGRELGLINLVVTNGALLTPQLIRQFREVELHSLIISLDAASGAVHDRHRGLPGLSAHLKNMVPLVREAGLRPVASVTVSRLLGDLDELVRTVAAMGFRGLTFSYPLTSLQSSYLSYADNPLVDFRPDELDRWFARLLGLKERSRFPILNPRLSLLDVRRQLQGRPARFPCLAGFKYFFADWHLKVFRCHFLPDELGPLEEIDTLTPIRDGCTACSIDCYRDPSVYQFIAVSLADALAACRRGEVWGGLKYLVEPRNVLSLTALLEGRHWVS